MTDRLYRKLSFSYTVPKPNTQAALEDAMAREGDILEEFCEYMTRCNQFEIAEEPDAFPCCIGCGEIRYIEPRNCRSLDYRSGAVLDPNCQHVHGAKALVKRKQGTCIDLACMMAAIYREKDGDHGAQVIIDFQVDANGRLKPGKFHARVKKGDGTVADPEQEAHQPKQPNEHHDCACGA